ncbi:IclR family transcriptional regulator [Amycolatopsis jiangsuensis]|uniref:DNA-binding IclR family transcriptional regulator n=1 Tax=Amycolatopsis jiangsuensis TaxID=1181879 RepID=A0A840J853_9PSEU|nr:helix-turn-helix domain-containing protein [Amycolatopsis jiangsuensis]MBB4689654.1 DNA-binding IclR family transcriptional regulator [Amycolatopsis jiangsuensis]
MPEPRPTAGGDTARRALLVLELVSRSSRPLMLDDLVRQTGFGKSLVYRLLRVLQEESFVEHAEGGGYRGGSRLYALGASALPNYDQYTAYVPMLEKLAEETEESATLHRRVGDRAVLITGAESTAHPLRRVWTAGELTFLSRGSSGMAILASLSDEEIDKIAAQEGSEGELRLRRDTRRIVKQGYAISSGVNHPGVNGISVALAGTEMSVSVSGPESRWTRQRMIEFAPRLIELTQPPPTV